MEATTFLCLVPPLKTETHGRQKTDHRSLRLESLS